MATSPKLPAVPAAWGVCVRPWVSSLERANQGKKPRYRGRGAGSCLRYGRMVQPGQVEGLWQKTPVDLHSEG